MACNLGQVGDFEHHQHAMTARQRRRWQKHSHIPVTRRRHPMTTCHRGLLRNSPHTAGPGAGDRRRAPQLAHAIGERIAHFWHARAPVREASAIADRAAGRSELRGRAPRVRKKRRRCPASVLRLAAETARGRAGDRGVRSLSDRAQESAMSASGRGWADRAGPFRRDATAPAGTALLAGTHRARERAAAW